MATVLTVHSSRLIRRKQNVALQCMLQHFPFLNNKNDEETPATVPDCASP